MRKLKIDNSKLIIIFLVLVLSIVHYPLSIPAFAADSTATSAAIPKSLQEKIDILKQEIASKAALIKSEVNKSLQNKVYAGQIMDKTVSKIGSSRITLNTKDGLKIVLTNEYTDYSDQVFKKAAVSLKTLTNEDSVAALGDIDDKNNLLAKKIIKLNLLKPKFPQIIWGQVQSVNINTIVIKNKDSQKVSLTTNSDTDFFLGNDEATLNDVKIDRFIISNGTWVDNGVLRSRFIYIIPKDGLKLEKPKNATPSATPSATPKKI